MKNIRNDLEVAFLSPLMGIYNTRYSKRQKSRLKASLLSKTFRGTTESAGIVPSPQATSLISLCELMTLVI